jgi:transcriptional regulator with XRE-family HTH domain
VANELTGARLRNLRMIHGLTREQMAPLLGYSAWHLGDLERGDTPIPDGLKERLRVVLKECRDALDRQMEGELG